MPKLTSFAATAMASVLRLQPQVLRGVQMRMVSAHGLFPKQTSAGRGSGLDATARNVAKLLMGWAVIGASADPNLRDKFNDLELAESNRGGPLALFGRRLESFIDSPQLARKVVEITIFPALASATVEYKGGDREQFGPKRAQHDGPQRGLVLPGRTLIQLADALAAAGEQAGADD